MFAHLHARFRRVRPSRWGRGVAVLLCVLALAVNLLGSVAYAEAWRGAAVTAALDPSLSICHSQPDTAPTPDHAPEHGQPAWKCPLCMVATAGVVAPPVQPPVVLPQAVAATRAEPPAPDAPKLAPVATRPGSRAPPLSA